MSDVVLLPSHIDRVEVFRSRALVTRRARVELPIRASTHTLRLGGLPIALDDDSLRVETLTPGARVCDLHIEWDIASRERSLRTAAEQKLRELERKRTDVLFARERAKSRIGLAESLEPHYYPPADIPESIAFREIRPLRAWLKLVDFVRDESLAQRQIVRQLDQEVEDLLDAIREVQDALRRESEAESDALATCRKAARVQVTSDDAMLDLEISYLVPGALWVPEYELRILEGRSEAELVIHALVAQRSGEDWQGVNLSFSAADLSRSAQLPELDSWRIGKAQPAKRSGWRELPDTLDELFDAYERGRTRDLPAPEIRSWPTLPETPKLAPLDSTAEPPDMASADTVRSPTRPRRPAAAGVVMVRPIPEPQAFAADEPLLAMDEALAEEEAFEADSDVMDRSAMPPPAQRVPLSERAQSLLAGKSRVRRRRQSKPEKKRQAQQHGPGTGSLPVRPPGISATRDALSFASLRMQGPTDAGRGQLRAANARQLIVEQLGDQADMPADLSGDALQRIAGAPAELRVSLPEHAVAIKQSAGHFAARFTTESPGQVPADGELHALTLARQLGAAQPIFRTVPSVSAHVYQMARFVNPLAVPLLAGPVRVYRGGDFVVSAPLPTTPPAKTLTVNLGIEPSIVVARNTQFKESSGGLFGSGTLLWHLVEIEINNKLPYSAHVEVFERVPTSREDEVKVEIVRSEPRARPYDQRERGLVLHGGWRFELDIAAHNKETCVLEYQISLPNKRVLAGGNRRD